MEDNDAQYFFRCSSAALERWRERAKKSDMTLSEWVRETLDAGRPLKRVTMPR